MRAWEIEKLSSQCQIPVQLEDNNEEIWLEQGTAQEESLHAAAKIYWGSRVPGSLFRDTMAVAAIQATENRGRIVERSDELLLAGPLRKTTSWSCTAPPTNCSRAAAMPSSTRALTTGSTGCMTPLTSTPQLSGCRSGRR